MFVPRSVSRYTRKVAASTETRGAKQQELLQVESTSEEVSKSASDSKQISTQATKPSNDDIKILILLALSDYSKSENGRFVPLSFLLPHLDAGAAIAVSEADVAKALRASAADALDVRMLISYSSASPLGGYEVRRKDIGDLWPSSKLDEAYWDERTVYLENIPMRYQSAAGIAQMVTSLLDAADLRVQHVRFLSHHWDPQGSVPKRKGFALVTLSDPQDVSALLSAYPWDSSAKRTDPAPDERGSEDSYWQAAREAGLRVLPKRWWVALNEEYQAYRARLLADAARDATTHVEAHSARMSVDQNGKDEGQTQSPPASSRLMLSSPFPYECLVLARNVHPDTNKTTLRKLFGHAYTDGDAGIDYVDFIKGTDTCYVRLASSYDAQKLCMYFTAPLAQNDGLDKEGCQPSAGTAPIKLELVQGRPEELYWEKVPEKVRAQAVRRAFELSESRMEVKGGEESALGENLESTGRCGKSAKRPSSPQPSSSLSLSSPFPPGCVVLVHNVHPQTNKSTLRKLFGRAFESKSRSVDGSLGTVGESLSKAGVDYVDFSKGLTSCHVRLASPAHAAVLCAFFHSSQIFQEDGLDDRGMFIGGEMSPDATPASLRVELTQGRAEEIYWEKIPEKVRLEAVRKAVELSRQKDAPSPPAKRARLG
ncbi:hypothetical protein FISHEDRAFT_62921 [Fistulina hepatica ATCC 64428]|uniref:XRRM domain-containing protein n=1 Tax=Fistulina hepatica ATCC 64428 TaxID=1128425 RepID=A0A0D7A171_9AGAR|nr:hypothetical protein FISHEDRAFT_62921 [Fistulina hepatica ATCC 64428]